MSFRGFNLIFPFSIKKREAERGGASAAAAAAAAATFGLGSDSASGDESDGDDMEPESHVPSKAERPALAQQAAARRRTPTPPFVFAFSLACRLLTSLFSIDLKGPVILVVRQFCLLLCVAPLPSTPFLSVEHFLASAEAQHLVAALRATEGELDVRARRVIAVANFSLRILFHCRSGWEEIRYSQIKIPSASIDGAGGEYGASDLQCVRANSHRTSPLSNAAAVCLPGYLCSSGNQDGTSTGNARNASSDAAEVWPWCSARNGSWTKFYDVSNRNNPNFDALAC